MQSDQLLTEKCVANRTTLSRATINRKVSSGDFPKPIWISKRRKVWKESEVERWIGARMQGLADSVPGCPPMSPWTDPE